MNVHNFSSVTYIRNGVINEHMRMAGQLMAPLYVEYVRWLKDKQDHLGWPVKIALRDGEPIYAVAKQMAALDSGNFSACNDWEPVWLNRYLVYRLIKYKNRHMGYYEEESESFYNLHQNIMKHWYIPKHGLDKTFIFADTGIQGRMSKGLNDLGYTNSPQFMLSCSEESELKTGYKMDSFGNQLDRVLSKMKEKSDNELLKRFRVGNLIYILDSVPKETSTAIRFVNRKKDDIYAGTWPKGKQEQIFRKDFYSGLRSGVAKYMENTPQERRFEKLIAGLTLSLAYINSVFAGNLSDESLNGIYKFRDEGRLMSGEELSIARRRLLEYYDELYR